jgi:hypothetical protein
MQEWIHIQVTSSAARPAMRSLQQAGELLLYQHSIAQSMPGHFVSGFPPLSLPLASSVSFALATCWSASDLSLSSNSNSTAREQFAVVIFAKKKDREMCKMSKRPDVA